MKRLNKSVCVIIAVLILVFSALSIFGVSYYTGDVKHTLFKGFGDLDWGADVSSSTKYILKPLDTDEESDTLALLHETAQAIENRAMRFGITDYDIFVNESEMQLSVAIPEGVNSDLSSKDVATALVQYGNVTVRPGNSYEKMIVDSAGGAAFIAPTKETAETIIINSGNVESASWMKYAQEGTDYYYLTLNLNDEGAGLMYDATNIDTGQLHNQTASIWLDDKMLASPTMSEEILDGTMTFTDPAITQSKAKLYTAIINEGTLPMTLSVVSVKTTSPALGSGITDVLMYAGLAAFVLVAIAMIIRYRLMGVVSMFAMLAQFSAVLAVLTRFFVQGRTFQLTMSGAAALAFSVMLSVFCCVLFGEKAKAEINSGTIVGTAVDKAIESSRKAIFDINVIIALISFVGIFIFGTWNLTFAIFGGVGVSGVYNFCYVAFFGAILNFVTGYFLPQLMARSLTSYNAFNKPSMFGGAK